MRHISVRVDDELYQKIKANADKDGVKVANYVRRKLRQNASNNSSSASNVDESTSALLRQLEAKDEQLSRRDEQIDHFQQIVAMSQKNIGALTEQLDDSRQLIEDMRSRSWWKRIFRR